MARWLAGVGGGVMLSGTNTDDLDDYRPDPGAASDHSVRHPLVQAGVDTRGARALCRQPGYFEIAELPAAPCLPSRIEAAALTSVHRVERELGQALRPEVVRCRIRQDAVAVELDEDALQDLLNGAAQGWRERIAGLARLHGLPDEIRFEAYRRGSAFVSHR